MAALALELVLHDPTAGLGVERPVGVLDPLGLGLQLRRGVRFAGCRQRAGNAHPHAQSVVRRLEPELELASGHPLAPEVDPVGALPRLQHDGVRAAAGLGASHGERLALDGRARPVDPDLRARRTLPS